MTSRRDVVFGASILFGIALRTALLFVPGFQGDQDGWSALARQAVTVGLPHVYELSLQQPALGVYPPVYHYLLSGVGRVYQRFFSPDFDFPTPTLNTLLKVVPLIGDCLLGLTAYRGLRQIASEAVARIAVAGLMLNSALWFNSAVWGMFGDSFYVWAAVIALVAVSLDRPGLAWIAITASAGCKPQALMFVPLILWYTLPSFSVSRWGRISLSAAITSLIIWWPFIVAGTLGQAVAALQQTTRLFPVLSANAHNFWYIIARGSWASDTSPSLGPLNARLVGLGLFGLAYGLGLYLLRDRDRSRLLSTAAYLAFAFFSLNTQMHENYIYPAVVLLTLGAYQSTPLKALAIVLSLTSLINMVLHDPSFFLLRWFDYTLVARWTILNSTVNVLCFVLWTYGLVRTLRKPAPTPASG